PDPGRDHQPRSSGGKPAEDVLQDRQVSVAETQATNRQSERPRYQNEPRDSSDRPERPAQFRSDTERDADDVRSGHQLAEGQDFGELLVVQPSLLFDDDAARPDEPAAEAEERDPEEAQKQRSQRDLLAGATRLDRLDHRFKASEGDGSQRGLHA